MPITINYSKCDFQETQQHKHAIASKAIPVPTLKPEGQFHMLVRFPHSSFVRFPHSSFVRFTCENEFLLLDGKKFYVHTGYKPDKQNCPVMKD